MLIVLCQATSQFGINSQPHQSFIFSFSARVWDGLYKTYQQVSKVPCGKLGTAGLICEFSIKRIA
jgi:hypothetical protein